METCLRRAAVLHPYPIIRSCATTENGHSPSALTYTMWVVVHHGSRPVMAACQLHTRQRTLKLQSWRLKGIRDSPSNCCAGATSDPFVAFLASNLGCYRDGRMTSRLMHA